MSRLKLFNRIGQGIRHFLGRCRKFSLFREPTSRKPHFHEILTLCEAANYLRIDTGTLIEEVANGHLPGGKLAGKWLFYKEALNIHFARYHGSGFDFDSNYRLRSDSEEWENNFENLAAQNVISCYERGERNFAGVQLNEESFYQAFLSGIILTDAALVEADLCEVDLSAADLSGANLRGASLIKTDLSEANLEGSDLTDACLISADLRWANLKKACLRKADLTGANLVGADLTGADLTETILDVVRWNKNDSKAY